MYRRGLELIEDGAFAEEMLSHVVDVLLLRKMETMGLAPLGSQDDRQDVTYSIRSYAEEPYSLLPIELITESEILDTLITGDGLAV